MKESDLQKRIVAALRRKGVFCSKIHGGPYQQSGLPDIIGCVEGDFFGFEVKLPGKETTLTKLQAKKLEQIKAAGGIGEMVTSVKEALEILDL